jgi:hypothetical protein
MGKLVKKKLKNSLFQGLDEYEQVGEIIFYNTS